MSSVSIIGSGGWGTAMAVLLANYGKNVCVWCHSENSLNELLSNRENTKLLPGIKIPENVEFTTSLEEACFLKDLIIIAVPSFAVRETAKKMASLIKNNQDILIISKGFDGDTLEPLGKVVKEEIENSVVSVMSGPSHAEEVGKNMPTTNVIASTDILVAKKLQKFISTPSFRVYTNDDITGVELGGSLKNIIALCVGICDGLGYGDNTKAALMTRGMAEIVRLGTIMGGKISTFAGLSGIGDLIVTCTSVHSRNRRCGELIGKGKTVEEAKKEVGMVVEGIKATKAAYELSKKYNVEMPIINEAYQVLFNNKKASDSVLDLMCRDMRPENDDLYDFVK